MLVSLKNIVEPSLPSVSLNSCLHRWLRMGDQVLEMPRVWEFSLQTCGFSSRTGEGNAGLFFPAADREVQQ